MHVYFYKMMWKSKNLMKKSAKDRIQKKIAKHGRGWIFSAQDFMPEFKRLSKMGENDFRFDFSRLLIYIN